LPLLDIDREILEDYILAFNHRTIYEEPELRIIFYTIQTILNRVQIVKQQTADQEESVAHLLSTTPCHSKKAVIPVSIEKNPPNMESSSLLCDGTGGTTLQLIVDSTTTLCFSIGLPSPEQREEMIRTKETLQSSTVSTGAGESFPKTTFRTGLFVTSLSTSNRHLFLLSKQEIKVLVIALQQETEGTDLRSEYCCEAVHIAYKNLTSFSRKAEENREKILSLLNPRTDIKIAVEKMVKQMARQNLELLSQSSPCPSC